MTGHSQREEAAPVSYAAAEDRLMGDSPVLLSSSVDPGIYLTFKYVTAH